jgi:outer membrane protein assembly factor BamE (lipoprotein component of BamABCDE complex)
MSFKFKNHLNKFFFILFIILNGCKLQEPAKNHGILFLENRTKKLVIQKSNKNDVLNVIGQPHSKSINDVNIWFYMERTLTKGKYHKLGKHVLKTNNVLVLQFDKYGVLQIKEILTKDDLKELSFSKKSTKNELTKKSFVEKFLSSVKQKMYGNKR